MHVIPLKLSIQQFIYTLTWIMLSIDFTFALVANIWDSIQKQLFAKLKTIVMMI